MGKMLVFSNPVEGREDDYNSWYDNVHLKDIVSIPSFKSGQRYRVTELDGLPPGSAHRYLAVYDFDGSPQKAFENMAAVAPNFEMSDALDPNVLIAFVEEM